LLERSEISLDIRIKGGDNGESIKVASPKSRTNLIKGEIAGKTDWYEIINNFLKEQ
jgi:hypothetical protein